MNTPVGSGTDPKNDEFLALALAKLGHLYADVPGGKHARLAAFQRDMFGLCEAGLLVPVQMPDAVHYHLAGKVPPGKTPMSLDALREMHQVQLRASACNRRLN